VDVRPLWFLSTGYKLMDEDQVGPEELVEAEVEVVEALHDVVVVVPRNQAEGVPVNLARR
jgi:hypothetical protein